MMTTGQRIRIMLGLSGIPNRAGTAVELSRKSSIELASSIRALFTDWGKQSLAARNYTRLGFLRVVENERYGTAPGSMPLRGIVRGAYSPRIFFIRSIISRGC